jgi:hypothetical protein
VVAKPYPEKVEKGGMFTNFQRAERPAMDKVYFSSLGFDFMTACMPPKAQKA